MITFEPLAGRGILFSSDANAVDIAHVGGKAAGLARLRDAGCDVPPWFVVTPDCNVDDHILSDALERLTAPQCHANPAECHPDMVSAAAELVEGCATTFAVRSSALAEDGASASYAGQFASLLFVPRHRVLDAIRRVRASAASENVRAYAGRDGAAGGRRDIAMAVIVQRMVDGGASGVAFGIDPVDGSDVVVVTAAYGLASGVVDGECTTDAWRVAHDGTIVT
ncbi:MAG TPA: PEP/pyruvate-binding domain-containing protein, partial [Candidatus Elarobacter sp.]